MSQKSKNHIMPTQTEKELSDRIAREFAAELRQRLGDRVQKIILYGSRARGDFWEWSDFDFVVIVNLNGEDLYTLDNRVMDVAGELFSQHNLLISAHVLRPEDWEFESWSPWGLNIQREGVEL